MKGTIVFDFDYTLADTAKFKEALATASFETEVIGRMADFLFPEAVSVLERLKAQGWNLALVTIGEPAWQKRKVLHSGLLGYFDAVMYTVESKETHAATYMAWPQPLIFINDHGGELDAMAKTLPEARLIALVGPKPLPTERNVPVCATLEEVYKLVADV